MIFSSVNLILLFIIKIVKIGTAWVQVANATVFRKVLQKNVY